MKCEIVRHGTEGSATSKSIMIDNHVDQRQLAALHQIEAEEREQLRLLGQNIEAAP